MQTSIRSITYWTIAAVFYLYEMILRASTSIMAQELSTSFALDASSLGLLSAAYYFSYTPLQLPCGLILDKLGARSLITFSCILCAASALLMAATNLFWIAFTARFLMGAGSACAFISCLSLVTGWFSVRHFALMAGMTNMMGCLGGVFSGEPLAWLLQHGGWRQSMNYLGIAGCVLAVLIWIFIKDAPRHEDQKQTSLGKALKMVMKKPQIWLSGIIGGFLYLPISAFAELWAIPFIKTVYTITEKEASLVPMALYIGMGVGSPIMAYIGDQCQNYVRVMRYSVLVSIGIFFMIAYAQFFPLWSIVTAAAIVGFILGSQIMLFSISQGNVPGYVSGTASAFTNAAIMFFGIIFQPLLGYILDISRIMLTGNQQENGIVYTADMYKYAMLSLPICFIASFILMIFLKNTHDAEKE